MVKRKGTTIRGKAAKDKGSRAERDVRDALKTIYPVELRNNIQRVPMSGAGWMKGDVYDGNDPDSCYEVKNQEKIKLSEWWAQAKSQANGIKTPILVITQAYRPFYYIMLNTAWDAMLERTEYSNFKGYKEVKNAANLFDHLAKLDEYEIMHMTISGDDCYMVPESFYLKVKTSLFNDKMLQS